jgi:hypothetical protein
VKYEHVGAHPLGEFRRLKMVLDVREAQARGYSERPGGCGQDNRLGDAEGRAAGDYVAGDVIPRIV